MGTGYNWKTILLFLENTDEIQKPTKKKRMEEDGKYRAVCDYISGMTDRYAALQANSIYELYFNHCRISSKARTIQKYLESGYR